MAFVILFFAVVSLLGKATSEVTNFHCTVPREALPNDFPVPSGSPTTGGIRSNYDIGVKTTRIVTGTMTTEDKLLNNNDGNTTTPTTSTTDFNISTGSLRTTATMGIINTTTNDVIPNGTPYPKSALSNDFPVPSGSPTTGGIRSNYDIGVETTRIVTGTMTTEDKLLNNNDGNTTTPTTSTTDFNTSTGSLRTTATMGIIDTTTNDVIPNGTPYPKSGCGVWIKRGSSLYYFITVKMERTIAAMQCNSMAAHLAYIENAQEAALIAELVGNCTTGFDLFVWMGLTDVETEGTWKWGPSLAYFFNWGSLIESEPNGGNQQNCGTIGVYSGKWYDTDCTKAYYAICEREI